MNAGSTTMLIDSYLDQIKGGDEGAIDRLVECAFERLILLCERIVGRMVGGKGDVRVSDVFQEVFFRLKNALMKDNVNPSDAAEFMGLAARHVRFQVLDMLRQAKKEKSSDDNTMLNNITDTRIDNDLEMWICFYQAFESIPKDQQQVADLLWTWVEGEGSKGKGGKAVPGMTQYEAADILGISRDRVKDLWRKAKIKIAQECRDFSPFAD